MVKWGVVSTGAHADSKIVPSMKLAVDTELIAVCSRSKERADLFASKHDVPMTFSSVEDLAQSDVEAVFITSPNASHADHTKLLAEHGKHVLCEKPMAITMESAQAMLETAKHNKIKLGIAFNLRHHPGHQYIKNILDKKSLGTINLIQGQWAFGKRTETIPEQRTGLRSWWHQPEVIGGSDSLMSTGIHVIDLIRYFIGQEALEVTAITDGQTTDRPLDVLAGVLVKFTGGAIASIFSGRTIPDSHNDLILYGSDGFAKGSGTISESLQGSIHIDSETIKYENSYEYYHLGNYVKEIEDFNKSVQTGSQPLATGEDGLQALAITLGAIESAKTGMTVKLK